jgi:hypothetical protein
MILVDVAGDGNGIAARAASADGPLDQRRCGRLTAAYRTPFELLAKKVIAPETKKPVCACPTGYFDTWLPGEDSNL